MPMSKLILVAGAVALTAWPCFAQEHQPNQPVPVEKAPATLPPVAEVAGPSCGPAACETPRLDYRVLWQPTAKAVQTLEGRDIIVKQPIKSLRVVTKPERRLVTVYVIKQREVEKTVPCTRMVDCTVTDPATGACHTVSQPITEMKVVKDTEFYTVPEEKEVFEPVSSLEEVTEFVPRKVTVLGWRVDMQKGEIPIVLPPQEISPNQVFLLPQPPCAEPYPPPTPVKKSPVETLPPPERGPGR